MSADSIKKRLVLVEHTFKKLYRFNRHLRETWFPHSVVIVFPGFDICSPATFIFLSCLPFRCASVLGKVNFVEGCVKKIVPNEIKLQ